MATLREIRKRISSVKSTQQITKAMKMVAAAKLRKAQEQITAFRPYAFELRNLIADLVARAGDVSQVELLKHRPVEKVLLVVVTADRGLCGAFNSNIVRHAAQRMNDYVNTEVEMYLVGRKGLEYFQHRDFPIQGNMINFFNSLRFEHAVQLSDKLVSLYLSGAFDRIEIIYNEFKSAIQQRVVTEQFLPFVPDQELSESSDQIDFIYEPDKIAILNAVIPKHLHVQIWRILLESNAAEQGARMTAMENATDSAEEMIHHLTLRYNRTRQASITKEIAEIVGGAEALKQN